MNQLPLYVLAESRGFVLSANRSGPVVEVMTVRHGPVERFGFFMSMLDAALCRDYLNRQAHAGTRNKYEIRSIDDPDVVQCVRDFGGAGQTGTVVMGFSVGPDQKLVVSDGLYSLVHMTCTAGDMNWLFAGVRRPQQTVFDAILRQFGGWGAQDHLEDVQMLVDLPPQSLTKLAEAALALIGVRTAGSDGGCAVFSPGRQAWRILQKA